MHFIRLLSLVLLGQVGEPLLPVTIQLTLDTELPLSDIRVSVVEKREIREMPSPEAKVKLRNLPRGDLHLLFSLGDVTLGRVTVSAAELGELIELKVRLVEGNAILLDESRVKGVSDDGPSGGSPIALPRVAPPPTGPPATAGTCPPPDEPVDVEGRVTRIVDNDSFVLEDSRARRFTIYVGSATRLHPGGVVKVNALKVNQRLQVRGASAAGPEGECSVGAQEMWLRN